jgi:S-adenosyl methyltransferase
LLTGRPEGATEYIHADVHEPEKILAASSYLAVRDGTDTDEAYREALRQYNATGAVPYHLRSPRQIAGFLDGLELVEPGVVSCPQWRPEIPALTPAEEVALYGGVGRKP